VFWRAHPPSRKKWVNSRSWLPSTRLAIFISQSKRVFVLVYVNLSDLIGIILRAGHTLWYPLWRTTSLKITSIYIHATPCRKCTVRPAAKSPIFRGLIVATAGREHCRLPASCISVIKQTVQSARSEVRKITNNWRLKPYSKLRYFLFHNQIKGFLCEHENLVVVT
jgi:hypothetical protein